MIVSVNIWPYIANDHDGTELPGAWEVVTHVERCGPVDIVVWPSFGAAVAAAEMLCDTHQTPTYTVWHDEHEELTVPAGWACGNG